MLKKLFLFILFFCFSFGEELEEYISKCNNGDSKACLEAGVFYDSKEKDIIKRRELQKPLFQNGCDLGNGMSCLNLHSIYIFENKFIEALQCLKTGCENLNHPTSCQQLGLAYKMGDYGLNKDIKKAKFYYKKACKLGSQLSCNYAKEL
ncbi:hypothetical protein CSPB12327_06735 [Campylobacter sp. RM12327]|uniref:hypothetical protein n=1 Tax=Campylobacter sputorum TaxID=206 RepID=UPI000B78F639|nr:MULTISPECIES: hypothetical protein [Campylobacter]ASM39529.1 hypothetical protein CSPB_0268 [Campylobacter sputorum]MBE7358710.1 hypothetical protein [Campylobacter sp. RM11302]MBF6669832.1 hypothetical protein [Campylobacter sp. RM12327]MBF6675034.1 hypothetical protein [Campylobacter sp. RM13538]MBF6676919.1 hypothetical protein [Campylobacter sp. RM12321]